MNDSNNSNAGKFLFIAGIITGAAATIYLNTPHGRKVRNAIVEKADEVSTSVSTKASEIAATAKDSARSAMDSATNQLNNLKTSAKSALDSASGTIDNVKNRFINTVEDAADTAEDVAETKASQFKTGVKKAKKSINSVNS